MDAAYLKFWGTLFNQAAENQRTIDDMTRWVSDGFKGGTSVLNLFRESINAGTVTGSQSDTWDEAALLEELQKSFDAFMSMFGLVTRSEYLALERKYEDMKETVAGQKETIERLRTLLGEKEESESASMQAFQDMAEKQAEQFASLMDSFGSFYTTPPSKEKDDA